MNCSIKKYTALGHQLDTIGKALDTIGVVMRALEEVGSPLASVLSMVVYVIGDEIDTIQAYGEERDR